MPHYDYNLKNKNWGKIISHVWDKLNEIIVEVNKLKKERNENITSK